MNSLFEIYLEDHYAGAVGGAELARRTEENNKGTQLEERFHKVRVQIEEDQQALHRIMDELGIEPNKLKDAGSWIAEKVGRLKFNGKFVEYSPLSRVLEVEGLIGAVNMKRRLWVALQQKGINHVVVPEELISRADEQLETLADLHRSAVELAFTD